jgi:hypothetical protein
LTRKIEHILCLAEQIRRDEVKNSLALGCDANAAYNAGMRAVVGFIAIAMAPMPVEVLPRFRPQGVR